MRDILHNLLILTFTVAMISGIYQNKDSYSEYKKLKSAEMGLKKKVSTISQQIDHMQTEIYNIKTSAIYAKKILKDKYHTAEDDEVIIFFDQ